MPHQGEVISTRDVIFDKENFFDKKNLSTDKELLAHMDELLARVSLEPSQAKNEEVLEEDEDLNPLPGNPKAPMTTKTKSCCWTKRKIIS